MKETIKEICKKYIQDKGDRIDWDDLYDYFLITYGDNFLEKFRTFYDNIDDDMFSLGYLYNEEKNAYEIIKEANNE